MKIVCAWCGKDMGEKNGNHEDGVSHGMCEECFTKIKAENVICEDNEPDAKQAEVAKFWTLPKL